VGGWWGGCVREDSNERNENGSEDKAARGRTYKSAQRKIKSLGDFQNA